LEGMQAGLSWITVLRKREAFREAFLNFEAEKIVHFSEAKVQDLMQNIAIIRNKRKIESVISNAKVFLEIKQQSSFSDFIWAFVGGEPQHNHWKTGAEIPANTEVSDCMAKALKQRGFKFVGTTICYAFMQATGMVNDHVMGCYRYHEAC
jgi:DNA-3-methyladenine glycosylase I